jgi:hypothetical protein
MFFTTIGRIAAWLLLAVGVLRVGIGFQVASIADDAQRAAATARYIGGGSSGEAIDGGFVIIGLAIALGVLCEISRNTHSPRD